MEIPLGKQPKKLRCERGMTQKQTAGAPGMSSVTYLHYEKAQREPPLPLLADMAKFYNVTTDYLLGLCEEPAPKT